MVSFYGYMLDLWLTVSVRILDTFHVALGTYGQLFPLEIPNSRPISVTVNVSLLGMHVYFFISLIMKNNDGQKITNFSNYAALNDGTW